MKRFVFKLENVLKYRITVEELAKNDYRNAQMILNLEREKLQRFQEQQHQLSQYYNIKAGAVVQAEMLLFVARCAAQLAELVRLQQDIIKKKEKIAAEKLQVWQQKRQDVKVVEKLKEKKWTHYLREVDKEDQKFQDEIYIAKKIRETRETLEP